MNEMKDEERGRLPMTSLNSTMRGGAAVGAAVVGALLLAACSGSGSGIAGNAADPATSHSSASARAETLVTQGTYVALGDSYTSAPGVPTKVGTPAGCERSSGNYPALVAQSLGLSAGRVNDVSCNGAKIANLTGAESTSNGVNAAQLSALTANTTLVTLGIGGNDIDFAGVLGRCVAVDLIPALVGGAASGLSPCESYYTSGGTDRIDQQIQSTATQLADVLSRITRSAPHARVFVVGYPDLLPPGGTSCAHKLGITSADLVFLNREESRLNAMLKSSAQTAGAVYVDTYTPSEGHDACADPTTRWTEPLVPASPAAPLHPNARGEQGMADAVLSAIKAA